MDKERIKTTAASEDSKEKLKQDRIQTIEWETQKPDEPTSDQHTDPEAAPDDDKDLREEDHSKEDKDLEEDDDRGYMHELTMEQSSDDSEDEENLNEDSEEDSSEDSTNAEDAAKQEELKKDAIRRDQKRIKKLWDREYRIRDAWKREQEKGQATQKSSHDTNQKSGLNEFSAENEFRNPLGQDADTPVKPSRMEQLVSSIKQDVISHQSDDSAAAEENPAATKENSDSSLRKRRNIRKKSAQTPEKKETHQTVKQERTDRKNPSQTKQKKERTSKVVSSKPGREHGRYVVRTKPIRTSNIRRSHRLVNDFKVPQQFEGVPSGQNVFESEFQKANRPSQKKKSIAESFIVDAAALQTLNERGTKGNRVHSSGIRGPEARSEVSSIHGQKIRSAVSNVHGRQRNQNSGVKGTVDRNLLSAVRANRTKRELSDGRRGVLNQETLQKESFQQANRKNGGRQAGSLQQGNQKHGSLKQGTYAETERRLTAPMIKGSLINQTSEFTDPFRNELGSSEENRNTTILRKNQNANRRQPNHEPHFSRIRGPEARSEVSSIRSQKERSVVSGIYGGQRRVNSGVRGTIDRNLASAIRTNRTKREILSRNEGGITNVSMKSGSIVKSGSRRTSPIIKGISVTNVQRREYRDFPADASVSVHGQRSSSSVVAGNANNFGIRGSIDRNLASAIRTNRTKREILSRNEGDTTNVSMKPGSIVKGGSRRTSPTIKGISVTNVQRREYRDFPTDAVESHSHNRNVDQVGRKSSITGQDKRTGTGQTGRVSAKTHQRKSSVSENGTVKRNLRVVAGKTLKAASVGGSVALKTTAKGGSAVIKTVRTARRINAKIQKVNQHADSLVGNKSMDSISGDSIKSAEAMAHKGVKYAKRTGKITYDVASTVYEKSKKVIREKRKAAGKAAGDLGRNGGTSVRKTKKTVQKAKRKVRQQQRRQARVRRIRAVAKVVRKIVKAVIKAIITIIKMISAAIPAGLIAMLIILMIGVTVLVAALLNDDDEKEAKTAYVDASAVLEGNELEIY